MWCKCATLAFEIRNLIEKFEHAGSVADDLAVNEEYTEPVMTSRNVQRVEGIFKLNSQKSILWAAAEAE